MRSRRQSPVAKGGLCVALSPSSVVKRGFTVPVPGTDTSIPELDAIRGAVGCSGSRREWPRIRHNAGDGRVSRRLLQTPSQPASRSETVERGLVCPCDSGHRTVRKAHVGAQ
jgi:hypothetical protein